MRVLLADRMCDPQILLVIVGSEINAARACADDELVTSVIPRGISVGALLWDDTHLGAVLTVDFVPNDYTSIS